MGHACDRNDHINRNHMDITKFSGLGDPEYVKVHGEIKRHITRLQGLLNRERESQYAMSQIGALSSSADADFKGLVCLNSLDNEELELRQAQIGRATEYTLQWMYSSSGQSGPGLAAWLQSGNGLFWINGRPGSGKSTAMKFLVEHSKTQELLQSSPRIPNLNCTDGEWVMINLFFTDRGSESQRSGGSVLRRMLFQLLKAKPSLIDQVLCFGKRKKCLVPGNEASKVHETADAVMYEWNEESLKQALLFCRNQRGKPFRCCIFLDGLDEHEGDHKKFGTFILSLVTKSEPEIVNIIKICVASRPEQVFQDIFEDYPSFAMHDYTDSDIRKHLDQRLGGHPSLKGISGQRRNELISMYDYIVKNAHGVFLWADSVAEEMYTGLENGETFSRLWELLEELPTDIENLYKQILEKIDPGLRVRAYIMLETVLRAREPLTLLQLTLIAHIAQKEIASRRPWSGIEVAEVGEFTDAKRLSRQLVTSCRCILERQPQRRSSRFQRSWTFSSKNSDDIGHVFEPQWKLKRLLHDIDDDDFSADFPDPDSHSSTSSPSDSMSEGQSWQTGQSTEPTGTGDLDFPIQLLNQEYDSEIEEMEHAQFRTYDGLQSVDPATDHVQLLHRSVKDFLLKQGSLNILFPNEGTDSVIRPQKPPGNGHLYILMFLRAWLKFPDSVRRQLRCKWDVALEVPYHACQLETTFPDYDPRILEEIDAEASIKSPLGDTWPEEWFMDRYTSPIHHWKFTFTAFAVAMGLTRYLSHVLSKSHTSPEQFINSKAARPLLHFAIYLTGVAPQPKMVRFLLERGANVDAQFENKSAMQSFPIPGCENDGEPHFSVISALLEGGADVNSRYYPTVQTTVHGWHPLLHVVGYASQSIDRAHRLLLLELLLKHDVDMNAKDGFGRSFIEVLYWNDKRLPPQTWQLMLDKGARITPAMVTRNDLYSQTDASPTIFSHLWTARYHEPIDNSDIAAFDGILLAEPRLGSNSAVARFSARHQSPMISDEGEEDERDAEHKRREHEEGLEIESNEYENERYQEDEEEQGFVEGKEEGYETEDSDSVNFGPSREDGKTDLPSSQDERNRSISNFETDLSQYRFHHYHQRSRFYHLVHVPVEARAAGVSPLRKPFASYHDKILGLDDCERDFYKTKLDRLSGKKDFEVFELGILDDSGPSETYQDAYKILRQEFF